ncbi:hypothetical protein AVEN_93386-1 [Araneus ventricosus]|uniref:Uncharacterized protein n=1 Tax=Araneus ventricosus TaxID=182803 RepID=A0A4Y2AQX5_ARAVE|nr:hypothetical protein AVEN_93386-1 [Araneus ventricosus]
MGDSHTLGASKTSISWRRDGRDGIGYEAILRTTLIKKRPNLEPDPRNMDLEAKVGYAIWKCDGRFPLFRASKTFMSWRRMVETIDTGKFLKLSIQKHHLEPLIWK